MVRETSQWEREEMEKVVSGDQETPVSGRRLGQEVAGFRFFFSV